MAQKLLSITLFTSSAKISEISKAGKRVYVYSCHNISIPDGICDDGVILDVDALASVLKQYMSVHKIRTKKLVFSLASKRIASKEVIIPFVKEKQIKNIININAPEYFPVANIDDYVLNYSIIEIVKNAENAQYRMNVTATPNEMLFAYKELAAAMKCDIDTIDYAGNAILQLLKYQAVPGEVCAILQLGYENTIINLMNGTVQVMQRTVSTGLNNLIAAVADSVGLDEDDAEAFLEDNEISRIARAYPDVKYVLDTLVSSIGRIFDFYNGRSADHPITRVKFIGDATDVEGIGDALSEGLGFQAEEIFTLAAVETKGKAVTKEEATNFMANIGAVLLPMNLQYEDKAEKEKAKDKDGKLPIWLVVFSAIAAIAMVASTFVFNKLSEQSLAELTNQVEALRPMRQLETEFQDKSALANQITGFYESTKGPNDSIMQLVNDLEKVMPEGTKIESLTIDGGNVALMAGGIGKRSVAKFITELKALNYVSNVHVEYITETNENFEKYDSFTMTFNILAPDVVAANEAESAEEASEDGTNIDNASAEGENQGEISVENGSQDEIIVENGSQDEIIVENGNQDEIVVDGSQENANPDETPVAETEESEGGN